MIGDINNILKSKGEALANSLGRLIDRFAPGWGAVIGAVGGLLGNLFGFGGGRGIIVEKVIDPIVVKPEHLSFGLGMMPSSTLMRGEFSPTGAGYMVQVEMKGEAKEWLSAAIAGQIQDEVQFGGDIGE